MSTEYNRPSRPYVNLHRNQRVVAETAGRIFAAFVSQGHPVEGHEDELIRRSIALAVQIAEAASASIDDPDEFRDEPGT